MIGALLRSIRNIILGVVVGIPLLLYPYLYLFQERLLFYPVPLSENERVTLARAYPKAELEIRALDGTRLHGWIYPAPTQPAPLLIYFGGNAEELSWLLPYSVPGWSLVLINYRGYGQSGGAPSEQALFQDALSIYDHFSPQATAVAAMGRSLGTGVAVYLASQRPLNALVLVSPYASIRAVAEEIYPFVPVRWLLKHPFDSLARAPALKTPMLALIAEHDDVIATHHSHTLLNAWGGSVTVKSYPHADHNSIINEDDYWAVIHTFLQHHISTPVKVSYHAVK
jgi:uncharacterized protein